MKKVMNKKRKLGVLFAGVIVMVMTAIPCTRVLAGDINSEESRVIGVASGTFYYDNEAYRAYDSYIGELSSYLAQDGVDLDSAEADALISEIYANVANGVEQGYLYKVEDVSGNDHTSTGEDVSEPDDSTEGTDNSTIGETSTEESSKQTTEKNTTEKQTTEKNTTEKNTTEKNATEKQTTENGSGITAGENNGDGILTSEEDVAELTTQDGTGAEGGMTESGVEGTVSGDAGKSTAKQEQSDKAVQVIEELGADEVDISQPDEEEATSKLTYDRQKQALTYEDKDTGRIITLPTVEYPSDMTGYTGMVFVVLIVMSAVIILLTLALFAGKCFSWQKKKRNRKTARYYIDHRMRRRMRFVVGNVFTVFLAVHIGAGLLLAGVTASLFRNRFVTEHLTSSGYYRYIYNEFQMDTARDLAYYDEEDVVIMLKTISYDRYLKQAKLQVEASLGGSTYSYDGDSLREELLNLELDNMTEEEQKLAASIIAGNMEAYTVDYVGSCIYGIKQGFMELVSECIWVLIFNVVVMITIVILMDRYRHRGVRYLSRGVIGGSGITILLTGWLVIFKPYGKIHMEPECLYLFLTDYLKRGSAVVLAIGCIGILAGVGLHFLVDVIRKKQMNDD